MRLIRTKNYEEMSLRAADVIAAQVISKPDCVLGLATGGPPVGTYRGLVKLYEEGRVDFSGVTSVNLDEYRGLSPEDSHSYRYFMNDNLFRHVNIDPSKTHVPDGLEPDADKACRAYDAVIDSMHGIDLQLLGLGPDGHIGFNEPADHFPVGTHCVKLTESTIEANKRFFSSIDDVPREAYTMGIGSIFKARRVLLLISGEGKAKILKETLTGPVIPQVPASILQLHPDVTVIADEAACAALD